MAEWVPRNFDNQLNHDLPIADREFVEAVQGIDGVVLDIASGPGGGFCARVMQDSAHGRLLVMSDLGRPVMRAWRNHLREVGWDDRCSNLACDARRLPFRDGSIACVTSVGGAQSVHGDGPAYEETSRVLMTGGRLLDWIVLYAEGSPSQREFREMGQTTTTWSEYEALMVRLGLEIERSCTARTFQGKRDPGDGLPLGADETWEYRLVFAVRR